MRFKLSSIKLHPMLHHVFNAYRFILLTNIRFIKKIKNFYFIQRSPNFQFFVFLTRNTRLIWDWHKGYAPSLVLTKE